MVKDIQGNIVSVGDMVAYVGSGDKKLSIGPVIKLTPKGVTIGYTTEYGDYTLNRGAELILLLPEPKSYDWRDQ